MSYLYCVCFFAYGGVQHMLCCVYIFVFLRHVYHVLPASLDCPLLIPPSVFSGVYLFIRDTLVIPGRNNILPLVPYENRCFWLNGVQCFIKCF